MNATELKPQAVKYAHTWSGEQPGHRCPNEGYCQSCDGGLDMCTTCGCDNQGGSTTDCPGERVGHLVTSFVYQSGFDFIDGEWIAPSQTGKLRRLITWADEKCERTRQQIARGDWAHQTQKLTLTIRPAKATS